MGNTIGSLIVYALLIWLCAYVARVWRRWFRSDPETDKLKWRRGAAAFGFASGSLSLVMIIALASHALITGGLPYDHPMLLFTLRAGFWAAALGLVTAVIGTGQLEVPTIVCSALCLLIWIAEAMAQ